MMLKEQLALLIKEFHSLKEKVKNKLDEAKKSLTETNQKLSESNSKLELSLKENSENEKVLTTLLKEFQELIKELC